MKYFRSLAAALLAMVPEKAVAQAAYPKELVPKTDFTIAGQGEESAGYSMTGSYTVIQNSEAHETLGIRDATVQFQSTLTIPAALTDWSFYSAFVQLGAPASDPMSMLDDQYYEAYTCAVRFLDSDAGKVDETNAFRWTTCGTTELSSMEPGNYRKFPEEAEACRAEYAIDFSRSSTTTGAGQSTVECAFSRDFLVPGLFAIRPGEPMVFRAGFNVYETGTTSRKAWGYSDSMEVSVPAPVEELLPPSAASTDLASAAASSAAVECECPAGAGTTVIIILLVILIIIAGVIGFLVYRQKVQKNDRTIGNTNGMD